jgi:CRISPR-associated protein Cas1
LSEPLYLTKDGKLERKENTVYFENEFQKVPIPIEQVSEIYCMGHVTITSGAIHFLAQKEISIHFFNHYGYYEASLWPKKKAVAGQIIISQARAYLDPEVRFRFASSFVIGASMNIINVLKNQERNGTSLTRVIDEIKSYLDGIPSISPAIPSLMGIEGNIRRLYYSALDEILPEWLMLSGRTYNPPSNAGNSLMSFCNSLSYTACLTEIYHTQLDPTISFLHEPGTKRFSLSLDIAEIFKPAITDRIFLKLSNRGQLDETHFDTDLHGTVLSEKGKRLVLKTFQEKMEDTITHKGLKRKVTYRRMIRLECYKLLNDLMLGELYHPLIAWW